MFNYNPLRLIKKGTRTKCCYLFLFVAEEGGSVHDTPVPVPRPFLLVYQIPTSDGGEGSSIRRLQRGDNNIKPTEGGAAVIHGQLMYP